MTYSYTVTKEMWIDFNIFVQQKMQKKSRLQWNVAMIFWLTTIAVCAVLLADSDLYREMTEIYSVVAVLFLLFCWNYIKAVFLWKKIIRKSLQKLLEQDPHSFREDDYTMEIKAGVLYVQSTGGKKTELPCTGIYRIGESGRCLFLFLSGYEAILVPQSLFQTAEEKRTFLDCFPCTALKGDTQTARSEGGQKQ